MLVLSRKKDESIKIGDDVVVTIVAIRRDKVRLGIDAPQDIPVHRREVYDAIKKENQKTAGLSRPEGQGAQYRENPIFFRDSLQANLEGPSLNYDSFYDTIKLNSYCR